MNNWITLLLAFGIPVGILAAWYLVKEFKEKRQWHKMWNDMENLANIDEGRERWQRFLKETDTEHKIPVSEAENIFKELWRDTRDERKSR